MSIKVPDMIERMFKAPTTRAAWISELPPKRGGCANCGGHGFFAAFIATDGPFQAPPGDPRKVVHWSERGWWVGSTVTASCPVCGGRARVLAAPEEEPARRSGKQTIQDILEGEL